MRFTVALATACALLLFSIGLVHSEELSDLKKQVEELQKKIEQLEEKQKEKAADVDYLLEQPSAQEVVDDALGKLPTLGAHFKFFLADQSDGERNDDDQHNSFSAGINDLWLYVSKGVADWLQITVAPQVHVEAAATPLLGSNINRSTSSNVDLDLDEGYMTLRLPRQFEVKAGGFYPLFSEEYGTKSWWHEQYHGNNGLLTLQAWQSTGIEIYRNFDFAAFSLPVYVYPFLNGEDRTFNQEGQDTRFTDNNSAKSGLIHIAPEAFVFGGRARLLGSFGWGRWDDDGDEDSFQWAAGADLTFGSLNLSGEYLYRWRENLPLTGGGTEDGEDKGWYIKANYTLNPQWRFLVKYSDVDLWFPSTNDLRTDNYKTFSAAVDFWITQSSTIIPQIEYVDAERSDGSEDLDYFRYTLGWRTTF